MFKNIVAAACVFCILLMSLGNITIFASDEAPEINEFFKKDNFDDLSAGDIDILRGWTLSGGTSFAAVAEDEDGKYIKIKDDSFSGTYEIKKSLLANSETSGNGYAVFSARVIAPRAGVHIMLKDNDDILCDLGMDGKNIWLQNHYSPSGNTDTIIARDVTISGKWYHIKIYVDFNEEKVSFAYGESEDAMTLHCNSAGEYKFNYYNYSGYFAEEITEISFFAWNNGTAGRTWYGIDDVCMYYGGTGDNVISNQAISEDKDEIRLSYTLSNTNDTELGSRYRVIGAEKADFSQSVVLKSGFTSEGGVRYKRTGAANEKYIRFELCPHTRLQTAAVKYESEIIENLVLSFERSADGRNINLHCNKGVAIIAHKDKDGALKNIDVGSMASNEVPSEVSLAVAAAEYSDVFSGYVLESLAKPRPLTPARHITVSPIYDNLIDRENMALGKTVTVNEYNESGSPVSSGKSPDLMIDGDPETVYNSSSTAMSGTVVLDLGEDISPYRLIKLSYNNIKNYSLYASYDNMKWELLYEGNNVYHGIDQFEIDNKAYRYIKVEVTECMKGVWITSGRDYCGFNIAELQVFNRDMEPEYEEEWTPEIYTEFMEDKINSILPDVSYAGYHYGEDEIPHIPQVADASEFGAVPDDGADDKAAIQAAIDYAASIGGGAVFVPAGTYDFNVSGTDKKMLEIFDDNIVIRGEEGTVFKLRNMVLNETAWHTAGIINFGNSVDQDALTVRYPDVTTIAEDIKKGDRIIKLKNTSNITAGDIIQIRQYNGSSGELTASQYAPLEIPAEFTSVHNASAGSTGYLWTAEVKRVLDGNQVELCQPARCDMPTKYSTDVFRFDYIREVGVENIRFESDYTARYAHHVSDEADYGWNAITMTAVAHGWVRNVVMDNFTSAFIGSHNRNVTVEDIDVYGRGGHNGVRHQCSSQDCLVQRMNVYDLRTHTVGFDSYGQGNVARYIYCYELGDDFDFHGGGAAQQNLYENLYNAGYIDGGGSPANLPHSGHYNVLWNWSMILSQMGHSANSFGSYGNEAIHSFYYKTGIPRFDHYTLYPKLIVVGLHSANPQRRVEIGRSTADRDTEEIYVEGLNRKNIAVESLYAAQLADRLSKGEYSMPDRE